MAIAAVRVQVPSRVRIRGKVRAHALTFLFYALSRACSSERAKNKKDTARFAGRLFLFQHVRAGTHRGSPERR